MINVYYNTKELVNKLCNEINNILKTKDTVVLAVPGGRSVRAIYDEFSLHEDLPWEKIHIFMVDERLVSIDDDQSNFKLVMEQFGNKLIEQKKISKQNFHPFIYDESNDNFGVEQYENELKRCGGMFDIVILGVGEDGHVAGLFPNYTIIDISDYFIKFDKSPKLPKERMSASKNLIEKSSIGVVLFVGEGKRNAYDSFLNPEKSIAECPAKILNNIKLGYILTDLE
jgi:6-phosphogluconolactonase